MKRTITKEDSNKFVKQLFESKKLNEDISDEELAKELAEALDNPELAEEIQGSLTWEEGRYQDRGEAGKFEADGEEYNIIKSEDEAERIALEIVTEQLDSEPELFNKDFLKSHMYIDDIARSEIANDDVDSRREDLNYYLEREDYDEVFERIQKGQEEYEALKERLDNDEDVKDEIEALANKYIEEWAEEEKESIEEALKDPVQYFVRDQGIYTEEELFKQKFISINVEEAAQEAVDTDGWEHFLSHYDGNYETTQSGYVFFRE